MKNNIYNFQYYRELFIRKHKSKDRKFNFGSPRDSSPWACGIWPLIGIFFVWTKEATFLSADGCWKRASDFSMPAYQLPRPAEAQWWKKTELVHQRAERNGGKIECHIEKCERTRFHNLSVQWACFKAGRRICSQSQRKTDRMYIYMEFWKPG